MSARCALLCLMLNAASTVLAEEYEVDGEIQQTSFKHDGSVGLVQHSTFAVFVKDCSWLIQTTALDAAGKPLFENETSCPNGAKVYSATRRLLDAAGKPLFENEASFINWAKVYSVKPRLDRDNIPNRSLGRLRWEQVKNIPGNLPIGSDEGNYVCHLWLMYASGCYFANLSTNSLTPVYDSNASVAVNPNLKRNAKWRLIRGPGSLPYGVTYLEGPCQDINATYLHAGVTNVANLRIPNGFVFEQRVGAGYAPGSILPGESAPSYRIRKRAVATVTAIKPFCSRDEFIPVEKGNDNSTKEQ